jgi:hypothetical protein
MITHIKEAITATTEFGPFDPGVYTVTIHGHVGQTTSLQYDDANGNPQIVVDSVQTDSWEDTLNMPDHMLTVVVAGGVDPIAVTLNKVI